MEHSIKKEVWEGKIPVCFSVDEGELDGGTRNIPEPCYVSLCFYSRRVPLLFTVIVIPHKHV